MIEKQQQENAVAAERIAEEQAADAVKVQQPPVAEVAVAEAVAKVTDKPAYVWSPQTEFSAKALVDTVLWREKFSDVSDQECLKVSDESSSITLLCTYCAQVANTW